MKLNRSYYKPKLYLSAKVRSENHARNNAAVECLGGLFDVFIPHEHQTCDSPHEDLPLSVYTMDVQAMEHADLALLIPPYGKDCSFEIGWLVARKTPVFMYVPEDLSFLGDAMVVGGLAAVFTANINVLKRLQSHPVLCRKVYYMKDKADLGMHVMRFYNDMSNGKILMEKS